MMQYSCSVCGFVYDEAAGYPEGDIAPGTKWEDIPEDWECPLCGAAKDEFAETERAAVPSLPETHDEMGADNVRELSFGELSALCSNLSRGCAKQYLMKESALYDELASYYKSKTELVGKDARLEALMTRIEQDLSTDYPAANKRAAQHADRGALRALVWGEKVTKILQSLLKRYESKQDSLLENTNLFVCEVCGFVFVGNEAPAVCPICKVQKDKLSKIERS